MDKGITIEFYRDYEFDIVRGICLGDESTKIDFPINDETLNTMASDFQYNEQTIRLDYGYEYRRKNYVKIDEMQVTSTNILSCNGIILKDGIKFFIGEALMDVSSGREIYKLYDKNVYKDKTYYNQTKEMVFEWAKKDIYKVVMMMDKIAGEAINRAMTEYTNHGSLYRMFFSPNIPEPQYSYSMHDLYLMTDSNIMEGDIRRRICCKVPNFDRRVRKWDYSADRYEHYLVLDYSKEVQKFIKEQEAKRCEEAK